MVRPLLEEIFLSYYWAKFEKIAKDTFRFDTRVYLNLMKNPSNTDQCIGAIVGKNPGSAVPLGHIKGVLQKVDLDGDKLLPNIRSIFLKAYKLKKKTISKNVYIQVLNLMYVCDKDLTVAIKKISAHPGQIICDTEKKDFPFMWFVWGSDNKKLNIYKDRFAPLSRGKNFYLDTKTGIVITNTPGSESSARHTQGLKHDLVVPYISRII